VLRWVERLQQETELTCADRTTARRIELQLGESRALRERRDRGTHIRVSFPVRTAHSTSTSTICETGHAHRFEALAGERRDGTVTLFVVIGLCVLVQRTELLKVFTLACVLHLLGHQMLVLLCVRGVTPLSMLVAVRLLLLVVALVVGLLLVVLVVVWLVVVEVGVVWLLRGVRLVRLAVAA
jgi:hypothetical protein